MAASTITRSTLTDDDGSGTTGSIVNNAELQKIYDNIDANAAGAGSYTTFTYGGNLRVEGTKGLGLKGNATPAVSAAGDASIAYNTTTARLEASVNGAAYRALDANALAVAFLM